MNNLDERAERAVLRRLGVSDMIHLITDQAKVLTKVKAQSVANGRFICKQRAELKVANERVAELEKALEYTEENVIDDKMNIKQVVRIALGKEPKRKVTFSNLGKYFGKQDKQE